MSYPKDLTIRGRKVALRGVTERDAEFILALRTDASLNRYLSATDNDLGRQRRWISEYRQRDTEWYFIIEDLTGAALGTVRIYDVRGKSFCWGSWVLAGDAPSHAAIESALLVYEFAFGWLGFSASHFDVRKDNERVIAFHRRFGARDAGEDDANLHFTYGRADYERARERYRKFLPDEVRVEPAGPPLARERGLSSGGESER